MNALTLTAPTAVLRRGVPVPGRLADPDHGSHGPEGSDGVRPGAGGRLPTEARHRAPAGQDRAPLLEAVRRESRSSLTRLHCPGHQGGSRASDDLTALIGPSALAADVWLETGQHDRVRREAEELAAQAWGARRAWMIGNGSTGGNLAWLMGSLKEGEEVVVGRDAHISVLSGLVLSGARPVWVAPRVHPVLGLPLGVEALDIHNTLLAHPRAKHLLVTSPGYASTCADLPEVLAVARRAQVRTYVDQAWGAHLAFHPSLPADALACGAEGAVVSLHKTGSALSSGALLLAGHGLSDENLDRVDSTVRMTQTTSPFMPLLASVDAARRDLAVGGARAVEHAVERARRVSRRLMRVRGIGVLTPADLDLPADRVDPLKVVVDVSGLSVTGWTVETSLRRMGVPPEGADAGRVYLVLPSTSRGGDGRITDQVMVDALVAGLERVARQAGRTRGRHRASHRPDRGPSAEAWRAAVVPDRQELTPRQAHRAPSRAVPLRAAVGEVAAEPVVPYPPGLPVLLPGEIVGEAAVEVLEAVRAAGGHLHGCADPTLRTLRVVQW
ncbi:MAG: DegT/DnrJ/EryC1/StrS family aminotransferase [Actinomycetota bacterium]|nr:DegT/DnrJ/EryC1/StrS family aminotransferase [Actinomycetota bacterium]